MAAYNKFNVFVEDLTNKVHDLFGTAGAGADTCKVALTNTAPVATNTVFANITEIAAGNGYTAGGTSVANVGTRSSGTFTMQGTSLTWTCVTAPMATFRYVVLYNDTPTSPADPLIAWWDYGSAVPLAVGESFSVKFNSAAVGAAGDIFTLA